MSQSHLSAALEILRDRSLSTAILGRDFEKLIQAALPQAPGVLGERFEKIWLWHEWPNHDGADTGIDLVAAEKDGGLCAIQCKCFDAKRRVSKKDIDGFLAASEPEHFTSRLLVNTGLPLTSHTLRTLERSPKPCRVLDRADLESWDVDWRQYLDTPEHLVIPRKPRFTPHPYQQEAVDAVLQGFQDYDRGQLILPCGTGKSAVTLWITERHVRAGGRVLYLVPSIALLSQTMREWSDQRRRDMCYVGICSDTRAGQTDEDTSLLELDWPVTTDPERILEALTQDQPDALTAVFCTYQSLPLVIDAQAQGAPAFALVICDEAHRTTGVESKSGDSPFLRVHDAQQFHAAKRLYTTATPRVYTEGIKGKAARAERNLYSMDDAAQYGPEFYRMSFAAAVNQKYLADYKVIVEVLQADTALAERIAQAATPDLNLDDAARLYGCSQAMAAPPDGNHSLRRCILFTNTIQDSRRIASEWVKLVGEDEAGNLTVEHVDGKQNALARQRKLAWLREEAADDTRILSNARCLSEGVDVPALDGVIFMRPRKSQVEVVQAVGRAMRTAPGKEYGYIILPIVIPEGVAPDQALNDSKRWEVVWSVLQALRSHDERLDMEINALDLNDGSSRVIVDSPEDLDIHGHQLKLHFDIPPQALYAKIVAKCGSRQYWGNWAKDVGDIAKRIRTRIAVLRDQRAEVRGLCDQLLDDLRATLNDSISQEAVLSLLVQHQVTRPVFQALFADYNFAAQNPVAHALDAIATQLAQAGLENETRDLEPFYDSVRQRASQLKTAHGRQTVLKELYEQFFQVAVKRDADRLGIVYTPVAVVDFLLHSADVALQKHLGYRLADKRVQIVDPFTGTGTFPARLLQDPTLIPDEALMSKYHHEIHANEMVLLAYYIAAVNIEEAYRSRFKESIRHEPFPGLAFTDTFTLGAGQKPFTALMAANSKQVKRQENLDITVIIGNPPYSAGQKSASDNNPNVSYPHLAQRIQGTYATASPVTNKVSLYDSYKLAIRWASDRLDHDAPTACQRKNTQAIRWASNRLGKTGVVAFVTNGSFLEGRADAGLRACLAQEFAHIYVVNLRGNARTQGERRRQEGGNVFGSGSRTPVALLILVKDPNHTGPAHIAYRDIGDYLSREQKLAWIQAQQSIAGIEDWHTITPDKHHDWLDQRDPTFQTFMPLGSKEAKSKKIAKPGVAARSYSSGIKTGCDAWLYSFDRAQLTARTQTLIHVYEQARQQVAQGTSSLEQATRPDKRIKWHWNLRQRLARNLAVREQEGDIRTVLYRPFVKQYVYDSPVLVQSRYQMSALFPTPETPNYVIGVPGIGETVSFSTLITDVVPDLHLNAGGQWFAYWHYVVYDPQSTDAWTEIGGGGAGYRTGLSAGGQHHRLVPPAVPRPLSYPTHHQR